jgi:hypothetical protein
MRRSFVIGCGIAAVALLGLTTGCTEAGSTGGPRAAMRLAVSTTAATTGHVRVRDVRVINRRINLREPILMATAGNEVTVTWAMRKHDGITLALDPETLDERVVGAFDYGASGATDARPRPTTSTNEKVTVPVAGGFLVVWTDEERSRVLAQKVDAGGVAIDEPVTVSRADMVVVGAPRAATADGRHVVVTFVTGDQRTFELVAASVDVTR